MSKTLIAGILNITPDSFSDGGKFLDKDAAIAHARQMILDGADILDVGAESTRPNAIPIGVDEEIARLEKILPALKNLGVQISVDTYKPEVAEFALTNGATMINDIHGLEDSRMIAVAEKFNAPVIAMHNEKCCDCSIVEDVKKFIRRTRLKFGGQIIFDVGIGFNKTQEENLELLRRLDEFKILDGQKNSLMAAKVLSAGRRAYRLTSATRRRARLAFGRLRRARILFAFTTSR